MIGGGEYTNPLFFSWSRLRYGTDPLSGYHLVLGYALIKDGYKDSIVTAKAEFAS